MKKILSFTLLVAIATTCLFTVTGCGNKKQKVVVGTMTLPGAPILEFIKEKYEAKGYELDIQIFGEFSLGNPALANGSYDANLFQHTPYLKNYNDKNGKDLAVAAKLYYPAYGAYSKTVDSLEALKKVEGGARVTIPNDQTNADRSLKILEVAGLLTLESGTEFGSYNIKTNPYNLKINAIDASLIASAVTTKSTDLGVINNTFASQAGFTNDDMLATEANDLQQTNGNILACRKEDLDSQWLKDLVEVLTSAETKEFINTKFKGTLIPLF